MPPLNRPVCASRAFRSPKTAGMLRRHARGARRDRVRRGSTPTRSVRSTSMSTAKITCSLLAVLALVVFTPTTAQAAIALVQTVGTATGSSSGATLVVNVSGAVTAGNSVILSFTMDDLNGAVGVTDTKGNTYVIDVDAVSNGQARTVVLSAHNVTALTTSDTITLTHPQTAKRAMAAFEFSGLKKTGALGRSSGGSDNSTAADSGFT